MNQVASTSQHRRGNVVGCNLLGEKENSPVEIPAKKPNNLTDE
jgi:hypothetical protein